LRTLERVERGEIADNSLDPADHALRVLGAPLSVESWQTGDRIEGFVRELGRMLRQGLAAGESTERQMSLIELGLARWFGLPGELPSRVQTRELDRSVKEAQTLVWQDIVRYAERNQLTVRKEGRSVLSPLGEVFQHLQGRDSVRWLLQIEAQLAIGENDPDRVSKEVAMAILYQESWPDVPEGTPCSQGTAQRLTHLGILTGAGTRFREWSISPLGKELLGELVQPSKTPLALLAESLCSDLVTATVHGVAGSAAAARNLAAEATASQARMVAHEVRNALLPVQAALDSLYREVLVLPPGDVLARRRSVIDGGIKGALRFTKELLQAAELGAKPPERFEPVQAVGDVVAELAGTSPVSISAPASASLPLLLGRREQFVLAVRNLLQNAIEHGGTKLRRICIDMVLDEKREAVLLTIDDDGQGVAEADRDRIFQEGVSNKPGGTGLGLLLVQRVVQEELRGVVVCTQSPLGGARFALRLPVAEVGQPQNAKEPNK
jgi:signal transduction histidine kinase